jgi:hypothetical protein|tara:strand:- start:224 stop:790 length:567 start_codon:yes stop_codon:yes gene_type:complete
MAFATIDVTKGITGTIPVANGGTGLTSGTSGQFLKFTGSTTLASAADNGKFNQYVIASETSQQTINSSGSFTNLTNVEVTITPSATNSKILLFVNTQAYIDHDTGWWINIDRNISGGASSQIYAETGKSSYINTASGDKIFWSAAAFTQDTSHSTTSAITYDVGIKTDGEVYMNYHKPSTIMAMEILA